MRIYTLIENLVYKKGLVAEHGLSLLIDTGNKKILFDTGQSGNFIANARRMHINLEEVDAVVISHGHYDHTGGLYPFLQLNSKAVVFIKKEAFFPKYHGNDNFIGVEYDEELLTNRIKYVEAVTEIDNDVFIMPDIPVINHTDTGFGDFTFKQDGRMINDQFNDELYICIRKSNELSILSSCSHRGITNIAAAASGCFNLPVKLIMGGFHIRNSKPEQLNMIKEEFTRLEVRSIGVCHCTGVEKYAELSEYFKEKVFYNYTGNITVIE